MKKEALEQHGVTRRSMSSIMACPPRHSNPPTTLHQTPQRQGECETKAQCWCWRLCQNRGTVNRVIPASCGLPRLAVPVPPTSSALTVPSLPSVCFSFLPFLSSILRQSLLLLLHGSVSFSLRLSLLEGASRA
ncbi:hypothetical protein E2C01_061157 [Portunus trituberculatus]|uniref:Uncharacterized protein n=1 Tax=Portunus trituberculatus TaxID=210409 RepID=A0A5B7HCG1_PORTR|nr:hypothetical protein [Portunus trituberculatus]